MKNRPLTVFAYAFPHRKTQDFLFELFVAGYRDVHVISAPWQKLAHEDTTQYFEQSLRRVPPQDTVALCTAFGYPFYEVEHGDVERIAEIRNIAGSSFAIISGARILKRAVIDLFSIGIVNFHPGKLPETAGLDLLSHTIRQGVPLGVTAHFIDHRVDAGEEIFFEETVIREWDNLEAVTENNYQTQIRALRRLLLELEQGELTSFPIDRPHKNQPLPPAQKREILASFSRWRNAQAYRQLTSRLFDACKIGNAQICREILKDAPFLIDARTPEGWTPLIVAVYNQNLDAASILLENGAEPNCPGVKGTTPLMYAKSALINQIDADYAIMQLLLDHGARISVKDVFDRSIIDYVSDSNDKRMLEWLEKSGG